MPESMYIGNIYNSYNKFQALYDKILTYSLLPIMYDFLKSGRETTQFGGFVNLRQIWPLFMH